MRFANQSPEEIKADAEINAQIMRDAQVAAAADPTHPSRWYFGIPHAEPIEQDRSSQC